MTKDNKEIEIVFAPGSFDDFEGTQEELDTMVEEIQAMAKSGELFDKARPVNIDEMEIEDMVRLAGALGIDIDSLGNEFIEYKETNKILQ
jgi:hypothetical protein